MRKTVAILSLAFCLIGSAVVAYSQDSAAKTNGAAPSGTTPAGPTAVITAASTPMDLARAALAAQGGDKFKNLKSLVLLGDVDLYAPGSAQSVPGKFEIVQASGDRYRLEVASVFAFKMAFNGERTTSSVAMFSLPDLTKVGLGVLTKLDQSGYTITALPDKKKQRAFRVTGPDGSVTDFVIDALTGRVVKYTVPFNGGSFIVEHDNMKEIDGVLVPHKIAQSFETSRGTFLAEFKVKKVTINQPVGDDIFVIQ